jgi:hypothetical protein
MRGVRCCSHRPVGGRFEISSVDGPQARGYKKDEAA